MIFIDDIEANISTNQDKCTKRNSNHGTPFSFITSCAVRNKREVLDTKMSVESIQKRALINIVDRDTLKSSQDIKKQLYDLKIEVRY